MATLAGLNIPALAPYISGMSKSRVPSPKETLKVRRLKPKAGDTIQLTGTITKVRDHENPRLTKVTLRIPGYGIPVTLSAATLFGDEDA